MQDKALFNQFVEFCESQPADRPINHYTYHTCAVGDFSREVFGMNDDVVSLEKLLGPSGPNTLHTRVGNAEGDLSVGDTYGKFTQFLKQYQEA